MFIDETWLKMTLPLKTEKLLIGHQILFDANSLTYFDLISNFTQFNFAIYLSYFLSLFSILFCGFCLISLIQKFEKKSLSKVRFIGQLFYTKKYIFSTIGIFLLFSKLFLWHSQLFIINNLNTNKVGKF